MAEREGFRGGLPPGKHFVFNHPDHKKNFENKCFFSSWSGVESTFVAPSQLSGTGCPGKMAGHTL